MQQPGHLRPSLPEPQDGGDAHPQHLRQAGPAGHLRRAPAGAGRPRLPAVGAGMGRARIGYRDHPSAMIEPTIAPEPLASAVARALVARLDAELTERYPNPADNHL